VTDVAETVKALKASGLAFEASFATCVENGHSVQIGEVKALYSVDIARLTADTSSIRVAT